MSTGADQHRPRPRPRHLRSLDDGQNRAARGGRCQSNVRAKAMPRPYAEAMRRGHEPRPCRGHAEAMRRGHAECEDKHIQGGGKAKKRKRQPTTASCSSTQITGEPRESRSVPAATRAVRPCGRRLSARLVGKVLFTRASPCPWLSRHRLCRREAASPPQQRGGTCAR